MLHTTSSTYNYSPLLTCSVMFTEMQYGMRYDLRRFTHLCPWFQVAPYSSNLSRRHPSRLCTRGKRCFFGCRRVLGSLCVTGHHRLCVTTSWDILTAKDAVWFSLFRPALANDRPSSESGEVPCSSSHFRTCLGTRLGQILKVVQFIKIPRKAIVHYISISLLG